MKFEIINSNSRLSESSPSIDYTFQFSTNNKKSSQKSNKNIYQVTCDLLPISICFGPIRVAMIGGENMCFKDTETALILFNQTCPDILMSFYSPLSNYGLQIIRNYLKCPPPKFWIYNNISSTSQQYHGENLAENGKTYNIVDYCFSNCGNTTTLLLAVNKLTSFIIEV